MERDALAPFGVIVLGSALFGAGVVGIVGGRGADALVVVGFVVVLAGGIWRNKLDGRPLGEIERRDLVVGGLLLVTFLGYLGLVGDLGLGRPVRIAVAVVTVGAVLGSGYLRHHRDVVEEYDEREVRIRYRAAYNGFLVLNALLLASTVLVYVATTDPPDDGPAYATGAMIGALVLMAGGILTFKVSEGWYQTRM